MGHYEKIWIDNLGGEKPIVYKRYVDVIFCLFENKTQAFAFHDYINKQHPNIKFTSEEEENSAFTIS